MKMYQYFCNTKPYVQLLILFILSFVLMMIGAFVSALFLPLFTSVEDILSDPTSAMTDVSFMRFMQGFTQVAYMLVPTLIFAFIFHGNIVEFLKLKFSKTQLVASVFAIVAFFCFMPIIDLFTRWNNAIHLPESMQYIETMIREMGKQSEDMIKLFLSDGSGVGVFFVNILVMAVIPAVSEELIFRGAIQQTCQKWFGNPHWAIIITAALFSFIHFDLFNFIPRFIMGILLGYIFYFTKSIWASILVHFMNNASVVVMTLFMGVEEMNNPMEYPSAIIEVVIITLTLVAGITVMYYGKKYLKARTENNAVE